jgi:hypothetical protein
MSLAEVLENNFKKGAVVFSSSDQLKEKKQQLFQYLKTAFPWEDKKLNSGFGVFAVVEWPRASSQDEPIVREVREQEGARDVGPKLWAKYDQGGMGDLPNVIREFSKLMLKESKIAEFIEKSKQTRYELGIDYYPNRAPKASGGYHKDAYKNTTFIMLAYLNDFPVWGAEWILDPGEPTELFRDRPFESVLPNEIQVAIQSYRGRVASGAIGSSDKEKDHEKWRQYSRCKIIAPMGNIAFFDPVVTHSSPYLEVEDISAKFVDWEETGEGVIQQDQVGFEDHTAIFRMEDPEKAERKTANEIGKWENYSVAVEKFPYLASAVTEAKLKKLERGKAWLDAKEGTFSTSRAFIRIEVRAYPATSKS